MKIFSLIIAFQPSLEAIFEKINILKKADVIPIVINNSDYVLPSSIDCIVLELGGNQGIATAQNKGIEYALSKGAEAFIFFDQDSVISEQLIQNLLEPIKSKTSQMSAPVFFDEKKNFFYKIIKVSSFGQVKKYSLEDINDQFFTNAVISSGHTVLASVFEQVGLFDDNLFIDYVDTEWCLRAASNGFLTKICSKAVMHHSIGDNVIDLKILKVPVHSPYRRYYRIRNAFILLRKKHIPVGLALREIFFSILHQLILILFCNNKWNYSRYLFRGLFDGIRGRSGKI